MDIGTIIKVLTHENKDWPNDENVYTFEPIEYNPTGIPGQNVNVQVSKQVAGRIQLLAKGIDPSPLLIDFALPCEIFTGRMWMMVAWSNGSLRVFINGLLATEIVFRQ